MRWLIFLPAACFAAALAMARQEPEAPGERPIFRGLTVKVSPKRTETAERLEDVAVQAAGRVGGRDASWQVREVRPTDGVFRLTPPARESSNVLTPAEAWQAAHVLRADPRFEYAEPAFAVNGAPAETTELEQCVAAHFESGSDTTPIEGATQDSEWSLDGVHGANVIEAWKRFGTAVPGHDVWIGHPDTGYRKHPEIWVPDGPLHPELGWDFVDNDGDPTDLFESGFLRWPGHGTKTSSVIVSPRGRQLPGGTAAGITGVAPGAKLIPLRVANGVVLLDQTNLAAAIRAAAGADPAHVKQKVDVISISLGGPPSRALEDAVRLAERNGVIIIAAAGNNVQTVVWPARYPNTIAMAASNFNNGIWKGSSGGSAVAISAPGESVWIANPKRDGDSTLDCLSMSSGTSFATATTAGIAALWVSLHRSTPQFMALAKAGQLTSAFRQILQSTRRMVPQWDTSRYGPGIVDAAAVLAAPRPPRHESAVIERSACEANLAALESVFDRTTSRRARIAALFGTTTGGVCAIAPLADEAAFHYATNPEVAGRIDAIGGAAPPRSADLAAARVALRSVGSRALREKIPAR
jgi:serine protease